MGAADLVPGVSGGTIAFISGIYEELLGSLKCLTPAALVVWHRQGFSAFWQYINGAFLITLFGGVLTSVFVLARLVERALSEYPELLWGFFFGLILVSIIYIAKQLPLIRPGIWLAMTLGCLVALGISMAKPVALPGLWWLMFLAGSFAICAMILPGISGSFLLLLMGMYPVVLEALAEFNWWLLMWFALGCVSGLTAFSHILSWLLRSYRGQTLAVLTGFLLGSLNIVWPWKHTLESLAGRHGEEIPLVQENVLPGAYYLATGHDPQTLGVILLALLGACLLLGLEYISVGVKLRESSV